MTIPYSPAFITQVRSGNVATITARDAVIQGTLKHAIRYPAGDKNATATTEFATRVPPFANHASLDQLLQAKGVVVTAKAPEGTPWWQTLLVDEPAVEVIDEMTKLEGEVTRRPVTEVMGELEAAEEAAEAAAREARRAVRETRKAEVAAGVEERVGKLKEKLHVA